MKYEAVIFDYANTLAYKNLKMPDENKFIIKELYSKGYRLAIISNSDRYGDGIWLRTQLESMNLLRYFEVVISSAIIGIAKPDPRIFDNVIKLMNINANKCLMVGDSLKCDIEGAQRIGLDTLHVDLETGAWTEDLKKMLGNSDNKIKLSHITEFELTSIECRARHLSEALSVDDHILIAGDEYRICKIDPVVTKEQIIHGSSSVKIKLVLDKQN